MAESSEKLCPAVAMYGPATVTGLKKGDVKKWCVCGLSKNQPWCDGSHKGTGFVPLTWTVPNDQTNYSICNCKHTSSPPFCDGTHNSLPEEVKGKQDACSNKDKHRKDCKLCTRCGWVPDF